MSSKKVVWFWLTVLLTGCVLLFFRARALETPEVRVYALSAPNGEKILIQCGIVSNALSYVVLERSPRGIQKTAVKGELSSINGKLHGYQTIEIANRTIPLVETHSFIEINEGMMCIRPIFLSFLTLSNYLTKSGIEPSMSDLLKFSQSSELQITNGDHLKKYGN